MTPAGIAFRPSSRQANILSIGSKSLPPVNPSARRVVIRNQSEETTSRPVTDDAFAWMQDPKFYYGGVPVGLDTIIAEHAAALHKQLDAELQQSPETATLTEADEVAEPGSSSTTGEENLP